MDIKNINDQTELWNHYSSLDVLHNEINICLSHKFGAFYYKLNPKWTFVNLYFLTSLQFIVNLWFLHVFFLRECVLFPPQ